MKTISTEKLDSFTEKCDEKCGETARFAIRSNDMTTIYLCPTCLLKWKAEISKAFLAWFKSIR